MGSDKISLPDLIFEQNSSQCDNINQIEVQDGMFAGSW
jgi:hypothetical protein